MKLRLYIDGASRGNPGPAAAGIVVLDPEGRVLAEIGEFLGVTTNNVAEYRALLRALEEASARRAEEVEIFSDSDLLVRQITGTYRVRNAHLVPLYAEALAGLRRFRRWRVNHIQRDENAAADALANRALDAARQRAHTARPRPGPAAPGSPTTPGARAAPGSPTTPGARATPGAPTTPGAPAARVQAALRRVAQGLDGTLGVGVKTTWDGATVYLEPDRRFPAASVFKIPVLLELLLQAEEGRIRLDEAVTVTEELKSPGSGVLKELNSSPALSLADLAMLMVIISDNTATDILLERVGMEAVNRRLAGWGLTATRVVMSCRQMLFELAGRAAGPFTPEARREVDAILKRRDRVFAGRAYADEDNNVTTPREMLALLEMLVAEGRLSPRVRQQALDILRRQQVRDRLPFHLPPEAEVAHKTGSIAGVRNDAGILFLPRGPALVCAFSRDLADDQAGSAAVAEVGRIVHDAFA